MKQPALLWEIYQQAEKWSKLPSEILFISEWFDARAVNQAVWHFGRSLEVALHEAEQKGKNEKDKQARRVGVLDRWLATGPGVKRHRDPATSEAMAKRI